MKKFAPLCFALITLCIGLTAFAGTNHKTVSAPVAENQDSTKHHHKDKHHPHVGGTSWTVMIYVGDLTGKPITGASVYAPCTGYPSKTTDAAGQVQFSGNSPCPCSAGVASISTPKGCNVKIAVSCDSTYSVSCAQ